MLLLKMENVSALKKKQLMHWVIALIVRFLAAKFVKKVIKPGAIYVEKIFLLV